MGVTPVAFIGVGSSSSASTGTPFGPNVVMSFKDAFFAESFPDPDLEGGEIGGLVIPPALRGAVKRSC
jgi:hypothetical protein